jgi:hypothetical protein
LLDRRFVLVLLLGYVFTRAAFGALVNPYFNGPDEGGHWEYVSSFVASGGRQVTGVEHRQPPTYYALAAVPWLATERASDEVRLLALRLLSAGAGVVTTWAAWLAARRVWPRRVLLAVAAAALAALVPGHLFLLSSFSNDPAAEALASLAVVAALDLERRCGAAGPRARQTWGAWRRWAGACVAAVAIKLTALPVVLATGAVLLAPHRRALWRRPAVRAALLSTAAAGATVYAWLLSQPPSTSYVASLAHFWWLALLRAPLAYVRAGGLAESFRTFWYAYDYGVTWPPSLEAALACAAVAALGAAALGLVWSGRTVPAVVWAAALIQVGLVVGRFGFGTVLNVAMGGAAQAKAFFPASVPLSILCVAGWTGLIERLRGGRKPDDRLVALGTLGALLLMDAASLAVTLWHHYRWWQVTS